MMNLLKIHHHPLFSHIPQIIPPHQPNFPLKFSSLSSSSTLSLLKPSFKLSCLSKTPPLLFNNEQEKIPQFEDLAPDGVVYLKTLRLVECSMFAAVTGLVYFLSNSLSIENYFGCFFSLPIVISSMRWGVAAGRKTMVATAMLLLVLSGPVKALIYILTHGILGFTMGSLWRLGANWGLSIFLCTIARAVGAMGYILTSSFLIRENILGLITISIHTTLTLIFTATGVNIIPSMNVIYIIFGTLVLLNCGFFVCLSCNLSCAIFEKIRGKKNGENTRIMESQRDI
ncbi:hypothetical protein LWI29_000900 [Acer saccharum]|uniref:Uncharacterized protein n=1 Tax=Acer saccharum TaxID=4024 RepID=A0AA39VAE7_ACESA|nr:hypothetical protein LWI29_000900 [Acer saccharum]